MTEAAWQRHRRRVAELSRGLTGSRGAVRLRKRTSNLFRPREDVERTELDVTALDHVIEIDEEARFADVEGMTPYADLVDATLPHGLAPAIVPELRSITVGGAMTGLGIESMAFRHGLVHHTVREMDVLVADGRVLSCSPKERPELFFGFPNSFGSLGYATRLRVGLVSVEKYLRLEHTRFSDSESLFAEIAEECNQPSCDYLDAVYFAPGEVVLTRAGFVDSLPAETAASDYTWMRQYWKSLREKREDYLTIHDYLWRWDTDWFWCSKSLGMNFKPLRFVMGRKRLNSITYQKIMRASHHWPLSMLQYVRPRTESVIQDVDIPIDNAAAFLADFEAHIGIRPVWICPFVVPDGRFSLFELRTDTPYINFGFWDMVRSCEPDGHYNALVEDLVARHGGKKSLYSRSTYDESRFWQEFDRATYESLKRECDPHGRFPGLYEKAVKSR
ncbi:MAG: FAD-binding protein [Gammaproteobacteria bacterium]|jgi:FAD/FMN-containing dehydrogenase|nr:FAD-binding protein [Gammaproteobacteria bacterium]NBD95403.1 FAD-binding protein [Gammaproteobacteria bacterium]